MTDFNLLQEGLECNRVMDKIWWYKSSIEVFLYHGQTDR